MISDRPILSGVMLPCKCRCCQEVIYPGNSYFVHTDADASDSDRVYIICSDCETSQKASRSKQREPGWKTNGSGKQTSGRIGTGSGASAGSSDGRKVNRMQKEKQLQIMGEITATLEGTGYQMKLGKNGYMFLNAKGTVIMKYLCTDLDTALQYAREIKEGKV